MPHTDVKETVNAVTICQVLIDLSRNVSNADADADAEKST
jgi:hypothetical protein